MADANYDQGVRREKDLLPYVVELLPEDEFGDLQFDGDLIFGHGGDGDVTITTNTSLTEDKYYGNLTINSGKVLNPNGFRVFVKNTLTLNGDLGVKEDATSVSTGSLEGTVAVGQNVVDGLGGSGEPDGYVPGYTFSSSGSVTSSVGVTVPDFYDLRDAINAYKQRGSDFIRVKGGAGGGTGADGISGAGADGSMGPGASNPHPNYQTVGAAGGKGSTGVAGTGGGGGRGSAVVMVSARQITGSGGLYSEGGAGVSGTAGTPGTKAPDATITPPSTLAPGNHHHRESGTPGANETPNPAVTNHHQNVVSPGTPFSGDHHHTSVTNPGEPYNHATQPTTNDPTHTSVGGNTNADTTNHHATPGTTNNPTHTFVPGNTNPDGTNHHTSSNPGTHVPSGGNHNPPVPYPGPGGHAPGNQNPTNHSYQPGNHHHSSAVSPGTPNPSNHFSTPGTHHGNPDGSAVSPGTTNPTNHFSTPGTHHGNPDGSGVNPPVQNHHTVTNPGGVNPDVPNTEHGAHTTPGTTNHHGVTNPSVTTNYPTEYYIGGAGGAGTDGQRGGRGGGGVLIVVTRKAGTPSYTLNTGVNGNAIALDTADI
ncbi:MAG: hypothetical protein HOI21_00545 [Bacteroidetes Order II. Incertae sedis bacterium]|jgi:hypothetical protein|nr:hypothetical protein [Bacteroidetes Order II. bacterium]